MNAQHLELMRTIAAVGPESPHYATKVKMTGDVAELLAEALSEVKGNACFVLKTHIQGQTVHMVCRVATTPIEAALVYLATQQKDTDAKAFYEEVERQGVQANAAFRSFEVLAAMNREWKVKIQESTGEANRVAIRQWAAPFGITVIEPATMTDGP